MALRKKKLGLWERSKHRWPSLHASPIKVLLSQVRRAIALVFSLSSRWLRECSMQLAAPQPAVHNHQALSTVVQLLALLRVVRVAVAVRAGPMLLMRSCRAERSG